MDRAVIRHVVLAVALALAGCTADHCPPAADGGDDSGSDAGRDAAVLAHGHLYLVLLTPDPTSPVFVCRDSTLVVTVTTDGASEGTQIARCVAGTAFFDAGPIRAGHHLVAVEDVVAVDVRGAYAGRALTHPEDCTADPSPAACAPLTVDVPPGATVYAAIVGHCIDLTDCPWGA